MTGVALMTAGVPVAVRAGDVAWRLPDDDIEGALERCESDLRSLAGSRMLLTGATGFVGSWLLSSLLRADDRLGLDLEIVVVTRSPSSVPTDFLQRITLVQGDVKALPEVGTFDFVLHGAASSSAEYGVGDGAPRRMAATIVDGTLAVLAVAERSRARLLFLSSGAVYGPQVDPVAEDSAVGPDPMDPRSTYGQAKRVAESLCADATSTGAVPAVVARLFSFVGPRIPLSAHFAAGNFLSDALEGKAIEVRGDGTARRSYLYAGDLPEWCWALLARGRAGAAYNVGSPVGVSIGELAELSAHLPDRPLTVNITGAPSDGPPSVYVPVIARAEQELGLAPRTDLGEALAKTYAWLRARSTRELRR